MPAATAIMLFLQAGLLGVFCFFSFYNYLYSLASFRRPRLRTTAHDNPEVAVVIVAFNEKYVLPGTLEACDRLSYERKVIVLADDSNDPEIVAANLSVARSRGCRLLRESQLGGAPEMPSEDVEIWESPGFVYIHRAVNDGFKAGSLRNVQCYLEWRGISYMYLLDADWHPQRDALERTVEVIEAHEDIAFVQTKRVTRPKELTLFQKHISMHEEGCYFVDFEGRQALHHPALFSGCCTLLRLSAIREVGGFTPGHLTEDLDLTNRLWLAGWRGVYRSDVINQGEVPFTYGDLQRQQERWAAGSARALRESFLPIVRSHRLGIGAKLAAIRQNAYFTGTLFTALAILLGIVTTVWIVLEQDSYAVEYYLYVVSSLRGPLLLVVWACLISNFMGPLVMAIKRGRPGDALHLPMAVWYAWSLLPTYVVGNVKGLIGVRMDWFRTPKFTRGGDVERRAPPLAPRLISVAACAVLMAFYFVEGWSFGWHDEFALMLIPGFVLAAVRS